MSSCCGQKYKIATKITLLFASFVLQFAASLLGSKVHLTPLMENFYQKANDCAHSEIGYTD